MRSPEKNWELEDQEQPQGRGGVQGAGGRQEGRWCRCWGRGTGLGVLERRREGGEGEASCAHREAGAEPKVPALELLVSGIQTYRASAAKGDSGLLTTEEYIAVLQKTNRKLVCSGVVWTLSLPFAPKTPGERVEEGRESTGLEGTCFPSKCEGR